MINIDRRTNLTDMTNKQKRSRLEDIEILEKKLDVVAKIGTKIKIRHKKTEKKEEFVQKKGTKSYHRTKNLPQNNQTPSILKKIQSKNLATENKTAPFSKRNDEPESGHQGVGASLRTEILKNNFPRHPATLIQLIFI